MSQSIPTPPTGFPDRGGNSDGTEGAPFPIVGIGASAGGLEALRRLLAALPVDTGMGFVIVQHLAPNHESSLTDILSRETKMPVCEVRDEPAVEPDHIYVIPPGRDMTITGGKLRLLPQERNARHRGIDQFFRSLAGDRRHQAIAVVLSGSASDGTLGVEEIKAVGGITFAQDESAQHDSMPLSAVASGCVDFVLAPEEIAVEIARIARHPYVAPVEEEEVVGAEHARIAQIVLRGTGTDFTHYKANTLRRRISRRMMMHKLETLKEYEDLLRQNSTELDALYQDLLIGVTSFFRNPDAYEALVNQVIPQLLKDRKSDDPVRIWALGCSTGEEAYSLAMVFAECAEAAGRSVPVQIFATDLNATAIDKARSGLYPRSIEADVSPTRLRQFFTEEERGYRISRDIRERCIFSQHNALLDPPFSRLDLISCRNMLIYLEPVLQQRIMPILHYALKPGGFLWLGSSETAGSYRTLFEMEDVRQKIFVRLPGTSLPRGGSKASDHLPATAFPSPSVKPQESAQTVLKSNVDRLLLEKFAPPGVVITAALEILQFRGDTGAYLTPAPGAPSQSLLKMLREGLLMGVRTAIKRAKEEKGTVREEGLRVRTSEGVREVAVEVIPLKVGVAGQGAFMLLFDDGARPVRHEPPPPPPPPSGSEAEEIARLHQELVAMQEYLQSVIEQQEAANEELQSANEEAQSANEEMQSVNEELETSKEEIQSSNEELATVNDELMSRNHEIRVARDYAENVVASLHVPLLVLNGTLRVQTASRVFYECFHVTPENTLGKLIYELGNHQWDIPALRKLLEEVLPRDKAIEHFEVHHTFETIGTRHMLLRASRLVQNRANEPLIVLSMEDVTEQTLAEAALRESEVRYRDLFDLSPVAVYSCDASGVIKKFNRHAAHLWGREPSIGDTDERFCGSYQLFRPDGTYLPRELCPMAQVLSGKLERVSDEKVFMVRPDGSQIAVVVNIRPLKNESGEVTGAINCFYDITERNQGDEARARLASIVESSGDAIISTNLEGVVESWNAGAERIFGYTAEEIMGQFVTVLMPPERVAEEVLILGHIHRGERVDNFETVRRRKEGELLDISLSASPIVDSTGKIIGVSKIARDITESKRVEQALADRVADLARADRSKDEFLAMLAHELRNPLAPLRNAAELLNVEHVSDDEREQAQIIIRRQIENMGRMLDDLLDVSRITEGKIELRKKPVALEVILNSAISLVSSSCAAQKQELRVTLPTEPVYLDCDATRLEQIFGNLLTNACKYSGEGSHIFISAELDRCAETPEVVVAVRDDGVGIDPELLPHIFDLFVQSSRTLDRAHGGLGIGLTLVHRLVNLHGGRIEARSEGMGKGAEFLVHLPILHESPAAPPLESSFRSERPRRILVVDDNTDSARTLAMLQGRRGHHTCTAFSGPEALCAVSEFKPEIVLLDIGLPGMDGFEVARRIRAMPDMDKALIIAMSGYGSADDLTMAKTAGFDHYLVKPVDLSTLRELLEKAHE